MKQNKTYNGWKNHTTWALNLVIGEMYFPIWNIETKEDLIDNIKVYVSDLNNYHAEDILFCGIANIDLDSTMENIIELKGEVA